MVVVASYDQYHYDRILPRLMYKIIKMYPAIIFSLQLAVRYMAVDSEHNLGITRGFNLLCEITFPATN